MTRLSLFFLACMVAVAGAHYIRSAHNSDQVIESDASASASVRLTSEVPDVKGIMPMKWGSFLPNTNTVASLDIPKYMGLWYQMYGNSFTSLTSGTGYSCATALYKLDSTTGKIVVHNYELGKDGKPKTIDGYATQPDASVPGQLKLHLDGVPVDGPYYILALGPIVGGVYQWAVVSDPMGASLFILARNVATFQSTYQDQVLSLVKGLGFTSFINKPVAVPQPSTCVYEKKILQKTSSSGTVTTLDVPSYMGLWYQMYGSPFVFATTSGEAPTCATATYTFDASTSHVLVNNYELNKSGSPESISGYAWIPDATQPGQLKLHLDGVPFTGDYWVYSLGPKNTKTGLYEWAVVSDPYKVSLFILARNPTTFAAKYQTQVLALVKSMGFTNFLNKPVAVPQPSTCVYGQK